MGLSLGLGVPGSLGFGTGTEVYRLEKGAPLPQTRATTPTFAGRKQRGKDLVI